MRCPQCDVELGANQTYCRKCGTSVNQKLLERQERDRLLALKAMDYRFPFAWIENELILTYYLQRKASSYFMSLVFMVPMIIPFFVRIGPTGIEFYDFLFTFSVLFYAMVVVYAAIIFGIQNRAKKGNSKPFPLYAPYIKYKMKRNGAQILEKAAEQRAKMPPSALSKTALDNEMKKNQFNWWKKALVVLATIGVGIVYIMMAYHLYGESLDAVRNQWDVDQIINDVYNQYHQSGIY